MKKVRTITARILAMILVPASIYMVGHLADPEYCPTLGWTATVLLIMLSATWAVYHGWLFRMRE